MARTARMASNLTAKLAQMSPSLTTAHGISKTTSQITSPYDDVMIDGTLEEYSDVVQRERVIEREKVIDGETVMVEETVVHRRGDVLLPVLLPDPENPNGSMTQDFLLYDVVLDASETTNRMVSAISTTILHTIGLTYRLTNKGNTKTYYDGPYAILQAEKVADSWKVLVDRPEDEDEDMADDNDDDETNGSNGMDGTH